jgi:hypothetical protein
LIITLAMSKDTLEYSHTLRVSPLSLPESFITLYTWYKPCRRVVRNQSLLGVTEKEKDKEQQSSSPTKERLSIEHEIECPRCHDLMILHSDFDRLCYFCEECSFMLSLDQ